MCAYVRARACVRMWVCGVVCCGVGVAPATGVMVLFLEPSRKVAVLRAPLQMGPTAHACPCLCLCL